MISTTAPDAFKGSVEVYSYLRDILSFMFAKHTILNHERVGEALKCISLLGFHITDGQHSVGTLASATPPFPFHSFNKFSDTCQSPAHLQSAHFQKIRPLAALASTYWETDTLVS